MKAKIDFLRPDQVRTDDESLKIYGKDWTTYYDIKASAVLFPESTQEVQKTVQWARAHRIGLVPSGGRTGLSGGACALHGEVVVSLERMNRILDYSESEQIVRSQAGVVTEVIQKFAQEKELFYPVDFAARGSSQIGGNVATNAGGIKVVKYGMTREWVSSLQVVTGTGEVLELGRNLIKNATGYDFKHLFIGSEGTLGFITEVSLRLTQKPNSPRVLLLSLNSLEQVMKVFSEFRKSTSLLAFEMFSKKALNHVLKSTALNFPLSSEGEYFVVLEAESPSEGDEAKIIKAFERCLEGSWISDGALAQSEDQAKTFWRFREDISESLARYHPYKNDISVPINEVPSFISALDKILSQSYPQWEVIWFGHIGDGNLHINILRPLGLSKEDFIKECRRVDVMVFSEVARHMGSISAEHGVGLSKRSFIHHTRSHFELEAMRGIKKIFDPDGILNPGKLLPD